MDVEQRLALVTRNTEEVVTDEELRKLLTEKEEPTAYIGFEPSGLVHLGWVLVAQKIRDLTDAGFRVTIFWADWHAYINERTRSSSSTPARSSTTSSTGRWRSRWPRSPRSPGSRGP